MQLLMDFLPLLAFFVAFKLSDIFIATGVLIVASVLQIICDRLFFGGFKKMHIAVFAVLLLFGLLTIIFRDPLFLKWKVTVAELLMAAAFFISHYLKRPLIGFAFKSMNLPAKILYRINLTWGFFSLLIAFLNIAVAFGLPHIMEDQELALQLWVDFKVWGILILSVILVVINCLMMYPYLPKEEGISEGSVASRSRLMVDKKSGVDELSRKI